MISFSSEEELINYLITSDFEDINLSHSDFKYLLNKFKYYYRIQNSRVVNKQHEIDKLNNKITSYVNNMAIIEKELEINDFRYERIKNKKLSFKERINGKIEE